MDKNAKKQLVFIDDSGDPGFKGSASSSAFVMAGAVIMSSEVASKINQEIVKLRGILGWQENTEFKFNKSIRKLRIKFLEDVSKYDFEVYAVYIDKTKIDYADNFKNSDGEYIYNKLIEILLRSMPLHEAVVKTDGKYGKRYKQRIRSYMRGSLNINEKRISDFEVIESHKDNLLQLADFMAGTINRSLQKDRTDSEVYIEIIRKKIIKLQELSLRDILDTRRD